MVAKVLIKHGEIKLKENKALTFLTKREFSSLTIQEGKAIPNVVAEY